MLHACIFRVPLQPDPVPKEPGTSIFSKMSRKNKSVGQLSAKTPESMTKKRNLPVIVISDNSEDKSDEHAHKSKRIKNIESTAELVKIQGSSGLLTLKGRDMYCLIRLPSDPSSSKCINDKVMDCCINIMSTTRLTRHGSLEVMAVDTNNTGIYARPYIHETTDEGELKSWAETGKQFLKSDLVFFPIYEKSHWYVGVLNLKYRKFEILDSRRFETEGLVGWLDFKLRCYYTKSTLNLRKGIQFLITLAHGIDKDLSLDITKWDVVVIKTPKQKDNHSCGLFALQFTELWEGNENSSSLFKLMQDPEVYGEQLFDKLICSEKNELKNVQAVRKMLPSHNMEMEKCHLGEKLSMVLSVAGPTTTR